MNKIILLIISLILLGFVVFLGGQLPYFIFYIFALSIILPLIHSLITIKRLDGQVILPQKDLYRGDDADITYIVDNKTPLLIPYLIIDNKIQSTLAMNQSKVATALPGMEMYRHHETINLKKRGYFEVGEIEVTIQDIFKLFKFKKIISSPTQLLVYPKIIKLNSFRTSSSQHQGELVSRNGRFEDRTRINTFRDYVEGDNIKAIHWKLTAKKDQTMIKLFDNRVDSTIGIFLDNSNKSYEMDVNNRLEDKAVDIALSIIDYCLNQNLNSTMIHQDKTNILKTSSDEIDDLKLFLEQLARLRATGEMSFTDLIVNNIASFNRGSSIIMITPNLDKSVGALALELLSKYYKPFLIVVRDKEKKTGKMSEDIQKKLIKENIPVYQINYNMNIKVVLEDYREESHKQ